MTQPNANTAHADDGAIATALDGVIARGEQSLLAESAAPGIGGARAALETFYYAFNTRSLDLVQRMWADDPNVELATPLVGVVRGSANIAAFYTRGFAGPARIQSTFEDIVAYATPELAVFAGRERGTYAPDGEHGAMSAEQREIRTTCICTFRYIAAQGGWRQVLHLVAFDDAEQLGQFQRAVRGA